MFRKELAMGTGMLFIYPEEKTLSFWMKNTLIPLSIGFFNKDGLLVDMQDMQPASMAEKNIQIYKSNGLAKYALEVPLGWFKKTKIKIGDRLKKENSSP